MGLAMDGSKTIDGWRGRGGENDSRIVIKSFCSWYN